MLKQFNRTTATIILSSALLRTPVVAQDICKNWQETFDSDKITVSCSLQVQATDGMPADLARYIYVKFSCGDRNIIAVPTIKITDVKKELDEGMPNVNFYRIGTAGKKLYILTEDEKKALLDANPGLKEAVAKDLTKFRHPPGRENIRAGK